MQGTSRLVIAEPRAIDVRRLGLPLRPEGVEAAVYAAPIVGEGILLGRFQRARSTLDLPRLEGSGLSLLRRRSGGPALRVGRGQVYVSLELRSPSALGGVADPARVLNRHVRPLLRALTALSDIAVTSGGRDVILARGTPVARVFVHHHRASGATGLEAIIHVSRGSDLAPELDLAHGVIERAPARTLTDVLGREVTPAEVVENVLRELTAVAGGSAEIFDPPGQGPRVDPDEAPFSAMIVEAIGLVGAVVERDGVAIGGDLMASDDALHALGRELLGLHDDDAVGRAIERHFEGAMLLGVRSHESIRKVVRAAKSATAPG